MIEIKRLLNDTRTCKALTGMSPLEFNQLLIRFEEAWYIYQKNKPNRKRAAGGGRRGKLPSSSEKLAFILIDLLPLKQTQQGMIFLVIVW